jgi:ribosomal protein S18 acetylase RimI-like enzyme
VIRRATPDDAEAIARVEMRTFRHAYADILDPQFLAEMELGERTAAWREALERDDRVVWVAEVEDRLVGYASARDRELRTLYVDPAAQGAGVGTRLLAEAEAAGVCELEVFADNGHGIAFYEARGWRDAGPAGEWMDKPLRRYVR